MLPAVPLIRIKWIILLQLFNNDRVINRMKYGQFFIVAIVLTFLMFSKGSAQLFVNNGAQIHVSTGCQIVIGGETQNIGPGIWNVNGTAFLHIFGNFRLLGGTVTFEDSSTGIITQNLFVSKNANLFRNGNGLFAVTRRVYNGGLIDNSGLFEVGVKN